MHQHFCPKRWSFSALCFVLFSRHIVTTHEVIYCMAPVFCGCDLNFCMHFACYSSDAYLNDCWICPCVCLGRAGDEKYLRVSFTTRAYWWYLFLCLPLSVNVGYHHIYDITFVRQSVTEGQRKWFDLEPNNAVALANGCSVEARKGESLWAPVVVLATGKNSSLLDEQYILKSRNAASTLTSYLATWLVLVTCSNGM